MLEDKKEANQIMSNGSLGDDENDCTRVSNSTAETRSALEAPSGVNPNETCATDEPPLKKAKSNDGWSSFCSFG